MDWTKRLEDLCMEMRLKAANGEIPRKMHVLFVVVGVIIKLLFVKGFGWIIGKNKERRGIPQLAGIQDQIRFVFGYVSA